MKLFIRCLAICWIGMLFSCIKDPKAGISPEKQPEGTTSINFELRMPATVSGITGTLPGTDQENHIATIDVLAFQVHDDGSETYLYKAQGSSITDLETSSVKQFSVMVYVKNFRQRFVIIANAREKTAAINEANVGETKEDLLSSLEFENSLIWHATDDDDFVPFPMWGESETAIISRDTKNIGRVKVVRMASRLDMVLTDEVQDFTFHSLHLYNRHINGSIVPDTGDGKWDSDALRALLPTMPLSGGVKIREAVTCQAVTSGGNRVIPAVYTFESPAVQWGSASSATCAIVGGYYKGADEPAYYRVDFVNRDDTDQAVGYADLLRNHLYRINILSVLDHGYKTPEEAFNSKTENMVVEIIPWDLGNMGNTIIDGQYMLSVNPDAFLLSREKQQIELVINTTWPEGWEITIDSENDWITHTSGAFGSVGSEDTAVFEIDENDIGNERIGYIIVTAGRLSDKVKVIQSPDNALSLTVLDSENYEVDELCFVCGLEQTIDPQSLHVKWSPDNETVYVTAFEVHANPFDPGSGDYPPHDATLSGAGSRDYTYIKPEPFSLADVDEKTGDPFLEKATMVNFFIGEGSKSISRSVTLRQIHYELLHYEEPQYEMDGGRYSFTIKTNGEWTATIKSGSNIISDITTNGHADTDGQQFWFTIVKDDGSIGSGTAVIEYTITGRNGEIIYREAIINAVGSQMALPTGEANSYLMVPGGDGLKIPVSQANADRNIRIKQGDELSARLLWTDHPNGLGSDAAVSNFTVTGTGPDATLDVYPGSEAGNALIGVYTSEGLVWSWHIWVCDYAPDNGGEVVNNENKTWMTWNLGALSDKPGDYRVFGLFYQWGRKDPFPGIYQRSPVTGVPVYDAAGGPVTILREHTPSSDNLDYAIKHPTSFLYGGTATTNDWLGNEVNNEIWGNSGTKTPFDPCPYGWRVPYGDYTTPPWPWTYGSSSYDNTLYHTYMSLLGYWSWGGCMHGEDGDYELTYPGKTTLYGYYWAAQTTGQTESRALMVGTATPEVSGGAQKGSGFSVRCIKE